MFGVRFFRNTFFALAAFIWLPASAHCQLESVPGLQFLRCSTETQSSHSPCKDGGCCSVEKMQYKSEQARLTISAPDLLLISFTPILDAPSSLPVEVSVGILTGAPPELFQNRQFISRAALPVRAPSFVS